MNEANIPAFLEPQWFLPLFVAMWFGITGLLSHLGGWASLATHFRAVQPKNGETFHFVSGSIGTGIFPVNYGGCLFVTVNSNGFHLSILFPFRFQSPPLDIPWSQVESVKETRLLFSRRTVIRLRNHWPTITIRGRAGQSIGEAYARASSVKRL